MGGAPWGAPWGAQGHGAQGPGAKGPQGPWTRWPMVPRAIGPGAYGPGAQGGPGGPLKSYARAVGFSFFIGNRQRLIRDRLIFIGFIYNYI